MITEIVLLQLGETMDEATIASWNKREGDRVAKGEALCSVETDKAVLDIEAPRDGYLVRIVAPAGATVPVLKVIGYVGDSATEAVGGGPAGDAPKANGAPMEADLTPLPPFPAGEGGDEPADAGRPVFVTPAAKRVAREHGIDAKALLGTGPGGRVVEADVWKHVKTREAAAKAPVAVAAPTNGGQVEPEIVAAPVAAAESTDEYDLQPLSKIRRIIAEKLSRSYREAVHVTLDCEVDMAEAAKLRAQVELEWLARHGVKVTYTDLIVRAIAKALTEHRALNATFTSEGIRLHKRVNVGVAMAIPGGLVVPVVRDADSRPLLEIARTIRQMTERARAGQIAPDDMRGGTFTISNMGTMGIDHFTPIINGGEGAILGVGRVAEKPVVRDGQIVARPMMALSLTFDHRGVDGSGAAAFLGRVRQILENPYLLLV